MNKISRIFQSCSEYKVSPDKLVIVVLGIFAMIILTWRYHDVRINAGDYVYLKQLIENIASNWKPVSDAQNAINDMLFSGTLVANPEEICIRDLSTKSYSDNLFHQHPYFILYGISWLANFIPAELVIGFFTIIGFFILIYCNYLYMRSSNIGVFLSITVLILFMSHPVWSLAMQGQYYAERLYLPLAAYLIWIVYQKNRNFLLILSVTILCALVTERTGIITGLFLILYAVLFNREEKIDRIKLLIIGLFSLIYSLILIKFYVDNPYYSSNFLPNSLGQLIDRLSRDDFSSKLNVFLFYNILTLGFFAIWNWRAFLIALIMMGPNIVGDIGGAEKTGFLTHYHTLYLPFLFWAVSLGITQFLLGFKRNKYSKKFLISALFIITPIFAFSNVDQGKKIIFSFDNLEKLTVIKSIKLLPEIFEEGSIAKINKQYDHIRTLIPQGSRVTTPEHGIPILEQNRKIYYYPLGLDVADYALLPYIIKDGKYFYNGVVNYKGFQNEINTCMNARLKKQGFNIDNPELVAGFAILKRNK